MMLKNNRRNYSTSSFRGNWSVKGQVPKGTSLFRTRELSPPIPILTIKNLDNKIITQDMGKLLRNKGGIYSFVNTVNNHQYIGSAKDLNLRLNEHLNNRKSNAALQKAIAKHGLDKFNFCIFEFFTYPSVL